MKRSPPSFFILIALIGGLAIFSSTLSKTPVLPLFALSLHATPAEIGWIVMASTLPGVLISYPAGALSDYLGQRRVLLTSLLVFATAPFLYLFIKTAGQLMAVLDDRDLKLERARVDSEREQALRKYRDAIAKHDKTGGGIAGAELAQAEAQLALIEEKLVRTRLVAQFDGVVVSGDLSQLLGSPVEQGKVLFEVAPLDAYRAILQVDERDMIYVRNGQQGWLALAGRSDEKLAFTVRQVTPVSTPSEGENTFRVEAKLDDAGVQLRPGMEGVGKIVVGERRLIWIWTYRAIDWLRLTLWRWTP